MPTNHLLNDHKQHDEREDMMVYERIFLEGKRIYNYIYRMYTLQPLKILQLKIQKKNAIQERRIYRFI